MRFSVFENIFVALIKYYVHLLVVCLKTMHPLKRLFRIDSKNMYSEVRRTDRNRT